MKRVKMIVKDGKIITDFEGFIGNDCSNEEDKIRLVLARMGVDTNVEHSDNKREATANGVAERQKN